MKDDLQVIMSYMNCEGEISRLQDWVISLSVSRPLELERTINELNDVIKQTNIQSHKYAGYYYLFLGCVYYEQGNNKRAIQSLQSAITEMWGQQINKILAHWLIGSCYFNLREFPKARRELEEALQLLAANGRVNSTLLKDKGNLPRQAIQHELENTLKLLFDQPLFRNVTPDPIQSIDRFPVQNPPESGKDTLPDSLEIPISVTNENYLVNRLSFKLPPSESTFKQENPNTEKAYENRTDDDGYLVIRSIPVYEGYVRAGQSNSPEPNIDLDNFAEIHQISIEGRLHTLHSLRSKSKQVNVIKENSWGWIKVKGKSMNSIKGNVSINDGDYVLFQKNSNADDNDIVIAVQRDELSTHVKRYRKFEKMLYSETGETGPEYAPIDIQENNVGIWGIVYVVAKPTSS